MTISDYTNIFLLLKISHPSLSSLHGAYLKYCYDRHWWLFSSSFIHKLFFRWHPTKTSKMCSLFFVFMYLSISMAHNIYAIIIYFCPQIVPYKANGSTLKLALVSLHDLMILWDLPYHLVQDFLVSFCIFLIFSHKSAIF